MKCKVQVFWRGLQWQESPEILVECDTIIFNILGPYTFPRFPWTRFSPFANVKCRMHVGEELIYNAIPLAPSSSQCWESPRSTSLLACFLSSLPLVLVHSLMPESHLPKSLGMSKILIYYGNQFTFNYILCIIITWLNIGLLGSLVSCIGGLHHRV